MLLKELIKEIENLEDQLGGVAECGDIPFYHKAAKNTKVYQIFSNWFTISKSPYHKQWWP